MRHLAESIIWWIQVSGVIVLIAMAVYVFWKRNT